MEYGEDDFIMLSGIQHFAFCRRQWALIHIENQWKENLLTTEGELLHKNAHDAYFTESRKNTIVTRAVPVFSRVMGVSGECDIVEYRKSDTGITLYGREGLYIPYPVEYKHGEPKGEDMDILQLTAQAMCLEEMLGCDILEGAVFYGKIKRRLKVTFEDQLKNTVKSSFSEMHELLKKGYVPKVKTTRACNSCSLKEICMPKLTKIKSAKKWVEQNLGGDDEV